MFRIEIYRCVNSNYEQITFHIYNIIWMLKLQSTGKKIPSKKSLMSAWICISANVFEPPEIIADRVSRIGFWYSMAVLLLICIDQLCTHVRLNILKGKMNLKYNKKVTEDYKTWYSRLIMGTTANFKNQKNCSTPSVRINRSMQAKEYFVILKVEILYRK